MRWGSGVWRAPTARWTCARLGQLRGDLVAGVPAAHDQHRARWKAARRAVVAAVQLRHLGAEVSGDRRRERHLERPGGDHDLVGLVGPVGELDEEAAVVAAARTGRGC